MALANTPNSVNQVLQRLKAERDAFQQERVRIAIIGESGHGKSSLINALVGRQVARVGVIETTTEPQDIEHEGVIFTDLPGCGTLTVPDDTYLERFHLLERYDAFLLVADRTITSGAAKLYRALKAAKRPVFLVRTKFDQALEAEARNGGREEEALRTEIGAYFTRELRSREQVFFTSDHAPHHDLPDLQQEMTDQLERISKTKAMRFRVYAKAYTEKALKAKRKDAATIVAWHAAASAAAGLIPVPGLDVAADVAVILDMNRALLGCYGLDEESLGYLERSTKGPLLGLLKKIGAQTAEMLTERFVLRLLARFAAAESVKEIAKFIPFIGLLVAAGIGYKLTTVFGEQMIEQCEASAREVLGDVAKLEAVG